MGSSISEIAFYCMENRNGDKDLEYLEKAYQVNPSIENTHNLAYHLMYEYGDKERSLILQKLVLEQKPSSYYPYASYAQMLQSIMLFTSRCRVHFMHRLVRNVLSIIGARGDTLQIN